MSEGQFASVSSRVSLNELGKVAFQTTLQGPFPRTQGIFLSNPDGSFKTIVDNTGEIASFDAPSLNNSGTVAFMGSKFVEGIQVLGIFASNGGPVSTVVDSTGPFASFREPSLIDLERSPSRRTSTNSVLTASRSRVSSRAMTRSETWCCRPATNTMVSE